jgi:hypothetical protein
MSRPTMGCVGDEPDNPAAAANGYLAGPIWSATKGVTNQTNTTDISNVLTKFVISLTYKSLPQGCTSRLRRICAHLGFFLRSEGERTQFDMKRRRTV